MKKKQSSSKTRNCIHLLLCAMLLSTVGCNGNPTTAPKQENETTANKEAAGEMMKAESILQTTSIVLPDPLTIEQSGEEIEQYLTEISIEGGQPDTEFSSDIKTYTVETAEDIVTFRVTPASSDMNVLVQIGAADYNNLEEYAVELNQANNAVITVSRSDYDSQVYTLHFIKRIDSRHIYVSENGSDDGDGSENKPFLTIEKAVETAREDSGDIIHILPGTYTVGEIIVPSGVSILGSGVDKTFINATVAHPIAYYNESTKELKEYNGTTPVGKVNCTLEAAAFRYMSSSSAEIAHFSLNGKIADQPRAYAGIILYNSESILAHDIAISEFEFTGIWAPQANKCHMYNLDVRNSALPTRAGCAANIMIGLSVDCTIHDCYVTEDRGAYAVKSWGARLKSTSPMESEDLRDYEIRNLKIYNNDLDVKQVGGWGQGQPNMSIELWSVVLDHCEIFNNRISDCVSLAHSLKAQYAEPLRVHHNQFLCDPWKSGYTYSIEASTSFTEIDHNYFHYGIYPIANFGSIKTGLNIHHNIFHDIEQISLWHSKEGFTSSSFVNNYIVFSSDDPNTKAFSLFMFGKAVCNNITIRDNIFYDARTNRSITSLFKFEEAGSLGTGCVIDNNLFFNCNPEGDNTAVADPLFLDNFLLPENSPARDMGIDSLMKVKIGLDKNRFLLQFRAAE